MTIKLHFAKSLAIPKENFDIMVMQPSSELTHAITYYHRCLAFAALHKITLVTACFEHKGGIAMAYISPEETVIQQACFMHGEFADTCEQGSDVEIFSTRWGNFALCCNTDALQPQYARLAAMKGCQLMFSSFGFDEENLLMAGPWASVQANCMAIVASRANDPKLILPCECTPDKSGFGRIEFDTTELDSAYKKFPVFKSLNPAFYKKYKEELTK